MNFQIFKLDLEKAEEPEIKFPTSAGGEETEGQGWPDPQGPEHKDLGFVLEQWGAPEVEQGMCHVRNVLQKAPDGLDR